MTQGAEGHLKGVLTAEIGEARQGTYVRWLRSSASHPVAPDAALCRRAWEVARQAARLLRERYQVRRVRVFGSLVHPIHFHSGSDIDLAVEGLSPERYWEAATMVLFHDERFPVELVDRATCDPEVWEAVEREGLEL